MSKEPNNIDRLVREKLDGFEMTPPPGVWKNTSASLQAGRKKRFLLWFTLGITIVALLATGIYFYSSENTSNEELLATNTTDRSSKSAEYHSEGKRKIGAGKSESSTDKTNANSTSELNGNSQNTSNPDNNISSEDANGKRTISSINLNMSREKIEARERQNSLKNQSKDNSAKRNKTTDSSDSQTTTNLTSDDQSMSNQTSNNLSFNGSGEDGKDQQSQEAGTEKNQDTANNNGSKSVNNSRNSNNGRINESRTNDRSFVNYSSLPTTAIQLIKTKQGSPELSEFNEEEPLPVRTPFWKAFSLESSLGVSTFKNRVPKSPTDTSFLAALSNTASGQLGLDFRFGVNYHFTDRLSFQTGIHYNSLREDYQFNSIETTTYTYYDTISFTVDTTTMDTTYIVNPVMYDSTSTVANSSQNTYKIFTLPFQFAWTQPISPRSSLEFSLGGAISVFGKNAGVVIVDASDYSVGAENAYHTTGMLSLGGSVKYLHRFGMHHAAYIEPWAQFGITNQSMPALSYSSLRQRYGIRVGYRFYF